ncbi:MAG: hypothetical protein RKE49_02285 [Oceanicaulis sp.]
MRLAFCVLALFICAAGAAAADMRLGVRAEVVERCAVEGLDAARLEDGVLEIETRCNAAAYTVRLDVGGAAIAVASVTSKDADVEQITGGAAVRQAAPGVRVIELTLAEPAQLSGRLKVRIETV